MNKELNTIITAELSKADVFDTIEDLQAEFENEYISEHVNEQNVMQDAKDFANDFYNSLTVLEDADDVKNEFIVTYGYDLDNWSNMDRDEKENFKDNLESLNIAYVSEIDEYYII